MSDPNFPAPPPGGGTPPPPGGTPPPPGGMPPPPGGGFPPAAPPPPPGGYGDGDGGFTPPPAQPYAGGGGQYPQLDVGASISYGWKKFQENVGPFIILVIAVFVAYIVIGLIQGLLTPNDSGTLALIWSLVVAVAFYIVGFIIQAGVWRAGLGVTRGETPSPSMLLETDNIGPYILTVIVVGLGAFVGFILCVIPGIIWLIFTAYAPLLALDRGVGPGDAIKQSIDWVKDNFGKVFLILLVSYIVYFVGFLLCCVGLLVTIPVSLVAITYSYRALNQEPVVP